MRVARLLLITTLLTSCIGALAAVAFTGSRRDVTIEMDRDLPRGMSSGFFPAERAGERTFAWTRARAVLRLPGLDRRRAWSCAVRVSASRPAEMPPPVLTVDVDRAEVLSVPIANTFEELVVPVPAAPPGLTLAMQTNTPFTPGGADPRALGIAVDRIVCTSTVAPLPSIATVRAAALVGGLAGLGFALAGVSLAGAVVSGGLLGVGAAWLLTTGFAPFTDFGADLVVLTLWAVGGGAIVARGLERLGGRPLQAAARFAVVVSSGALVLELGALMHPSKLVIDALFQAHRLDAVLAGQYLFTQPMPDGVRFPYAIALYVFASPWASLVTDHMLLLRLVVVSATVVSGALLYPMAVRAWQAPWAALLAVVLFHLVPVPFSVVGNANLTNAFGQAMATIAVAVVTLTTGPRWRWAGPILLTAVTATALLSHVSTMTLLPAVLAALLVTSWVRGGDGRRVARVIAGGTVVAVVLAAGLYYRHFTDVYVEAFGKVIGRAEAGGGTDAPGTDAPRNVSPDPTLGRAAQMATRARVSGRQIAVDLGGALLLLGVLGAARLRRGADDGRLTASLVAWMAVWVLFVVAGLFMRVGPQYERYALEFLARVDAATVPAVALLAAGGAAWLWERRGGWSTALAGRTLAAALVLAAVARASTLWMDWVR